MKKIMLAVSLIWASASFAQELKPYSNPIAYQRADPFVTKAEDGNYYFIATVPEYDRIEIRKAASIHAIEKAEKVVVWRKHLTGNMGNHIWAPELHRINGKWYIYFAAGSAEDKWKIRKYALSNPSPDPTKGIWTEEGEMSTSPNIFTLDATTFEHKGQLYHIWVDRAPSEKVNTSLFIAKMKDPVTIDEKYAIITQPEYEWEERGHRVNEGPAVLIRNGKVFVTFSASATDHNYCIGLLWADENADLIDPKSWNKLSEPVFYTNEKLKRFGPGHNSFTIAEDGKTDIMIYHARDYKEIKGEPLYDSNRHARARVLRWTADGMPDFMQDLDDHETFTQKGLKK